MRHHQRLSIVGLLVIGLSCKNDKAVPISETVRHTWTAQSVHENSTLVYTKGSTTNIRNYSNFRLDLSSPPTAQLTDFDGNAFVGQYEFQGDTKLILKNLQPQPTDTNGTMEFTINSASGVSLDISRTSASRKTGGSFNQYELTSN